MVFGLYPDFWKHLLGKLSFLCKAVKAISVEVMRYISNQSLSARDWRKVCLLHTYIHCLYIHCLYIYTSYIHCRQKYGKIGNTMETLVFDMFDLQEMDWFHPQTSIVTLMHPTHVVLWTKNAIGNVRNWRYKMQCIWMYHFFNDSPKMSHISQGIHVITLWIYENSVCIL